MFFWFCLEGILKEKLENPVLVPKRKMEAVVIHSKGKSLDFHALHTQFHIQFVNLGEYRFEKVPIPEPGPKEILVKVLAVGICAGDGKVLDGAERFWGKPGKCFVLQSFAMHHFAHVLD